MRAVFGLVLLIGMGLAGFAVYTVKGYFDSQERRIAQERARAAQAVETVDVYSPTRALTYGDLLTSEDVQLIKYAKDYLPAGIFQTEEEIFPDGLDVPRVVTLPMDINEPITSNKVTEPGAPRGITALLEPGMRAYPLPANLTQAFAEELRPTDRVDIYWSGRLGREETTSIIMTGVEIISVDQEATGRRGIGVVLQVTPEEFAALAAAQNAGNLSLTPVGTGDDTVVSDIQTNINDVLGIEAPVVVEAPEPVAAPKVCTRTERRGVETITRTVPCPEVQQ